MAQGELRINHILRIMRGISSTVQSNDLAKLLKETEDLCDSFTGKGDLMLEARLSGVRETLKLLLDKPSAVESWIVSGCQKTKHRWGGGSGDE